MEPEEFSGMRVILSSIHLQRGTVLIDGVSYDNDQQLVCEPPDESFRDARGLLTRLPRGENAHRRSPKRVDVKCQRQGREWSEK